MTGIGLDLHSTSLKNKCKAIVSEMQERTVITNYYDNIGGGRNRYRTPNRGAIWRRSRRSSLFSTVQSFPAAVGLFVVDSFVSLPGALGGASRGILLIFRIYQRLRPPSGKKAEDVVRIGGKYLTAE
jgi:hypothetical protein